MGSYHSLNPMTLEQDCWIFCDYLFIGRYHRATEIPCPRWVRKLLNVSLEQLYSLQSCVHSFLVHSVLIYSKWFSFILCPIQQFSCFLNSPEKQENNKIEKVRRRRMNKDATIDFLEILVHNGRIQ